MIRPLFAVLILAAALVPLQTASADPNPATQDLTQACLARPDATPETVTQSGVQGAVAGEWVNFTQEVTFDEGDIFQDILQRPDGSTYFSSRMELTVLPSNLNVDMASVDFAIAPGGSPNPFTAAVSQPWVVGTQPDLTQWVIETDTSGTNPTFRLLFPGDVAMMLADQNGNGELSYSVPAGGEVFVLSYRAQVPPTGETWGDVHDGGECFASVSTDPSNRDTDRIRSAVAVVEPYIEIAKTTAPANVYNAGNVVEYDLDITVPQSNPTNGSLAVAPARDVIVVDSVPAGLIPLDAAGNPVADGGTTTGGGVWDATTREVTYTLGDILPGNDVTITEEMEIATGLDPSDSLVNSAYVGFSYLPDGSDDNTTVDNFADDDAEVFVASEPPTVSKEANIERTGTDLPFQYTVTIDIPANSTYENFTIFDNLPDGLQFISYDSATCLPATANCPAGIPPLTQTVFAGGGTGIGWYPNSIPLDPNPRQLVLTYTAQIDPAYANGDEVVFFDEFENDLRLNWNTVDRIGDVNPSTASPPSYDGEESTSDIVIYDRPILEIDKTVATTDGVEADETREQWDYEIGDIATYTSEITNVGSRDATNLTVVDTPVGIDIDPASITVGGNPCGAPTCTWDGATLTITIPGPLAAFTGTETITYEATPTQNGDLDNAISIPSYGDDLGATYTENPGDTVPLEIPDPELTIEKSPAPEATTGVANSIGTQFPFVFTVTNVSNTTAYNAIVTDVPPTSLCTVAGGLDSGAVGVTETAPGVWSLDNPLAPGASVTFEAYIEVCGPIEPGTYENVAELTWEDLTDNQSQAGSTYEDEDPADLVLVAPEYEVEKGPAIGAGATINWSADVDENGTVDFPSEINYGAWTVIIKNTSTVPIGGLVVDDLMPEPFEYLPQDPGTGILWIGQVPSTFVDNSAASGTATLPGYTEQVDFTLGQLQPGAEVRITIPFAHNGEDPPDGNLTRVNTVDVTNPNITFDPAVHQAQGEYTLIPVEVGPSISKTVEAVDIHPGVEVMEGAPGAQFDFSIDVTVPTSSTLWNYDLWIMDEMPDGLTLVNEPAIGAIPGAGGWTVSCVSGPCPASEGGVYVGQNPGLNGVTELGWFLGDTPPDPSETPSVYRLTFRVEVEKNFDSGDEIIDGFSEPLINTAKPIFNRDGSVPGGSGNVVAGAPAGFPDPADYDRVYPKDPAEIDIVTPRLDFEKTVYNEDGDPVTEISAGESFEYEIIVTNVGSGPAFSIDIQDDLANPGGIPFANIDQSSLNVTPAGVTCNFIAVGGGDNLECEFAGPLAGDPDGPAGAGIGGQIVITYDATTVDNDDFYAQQSTQNQDPMIILNRASTSEYFEAANEGGNQYATGQTISRLYAFTPVAEVDASCVGGADILPEAPVGSEVQFWVKAGNGDRFDVNGNPDGDLTLTPYPTVDNDGDGFPDAGVGFNPELRVTIQDKFTYLGTQGTGPGAGDPTYTTYSPFPAPDQILDEVQPGTYTLVWNTSLQDIPHSPNHATEADFMPHYDLLIDVVKTEPGGATIWFDLTLEDAAGNTDRGNNVGEPWEFVEKDRHGCPGGPPPRVWKTPDVEDAVKLAPGQADEFVMYIQVPDEAGMAGNFVDTLPDGLMYAGDLPVGDPNYAEATIDVVPSTWTNDNDGDGDVDLQDYFTSSVAQNNGDTVITWDPPPLPYGIANDPLASGSDTRHVIRVPVIALDDPPYPNEFVVNGFSWNTEDFGTRKDSGAMLTEGSGQPSIKKRVNKNDGTYGDTFTYTVDVTIPAGYSGKDVIVYDEINNHRNWDPAPYTFQDLGNLHLNQTIFPVSVGAQGPVAAGELYYGHWLYSPAEMQLDDYLTDNCVVGCSSAADTIDAVPMTPLLHSDAASLPLSSSDQYTRDNNGAAGWYLGDIDVDPENQDRVVRLTYAVEAPTLLEQRQRIADLWPTGVPGGATDPLFDDVTSYWFQELSQVEHTNQVQIRAFASDNDVMAQWDGLGDDAWETLPSQAWGDEVSSSASLATADESVTVAYPLITMDKNCKGLGGTNDANPAATPVGTANVSCEITVTNASPVDAYDITITDTPLTDCILGARAYHGLVRYKTAISGVAGVDDPYDPAVVRYPCDISGVNTGSHPGLTSAPNTYPVEWNLAIGPNQSETLTHQLRIDGWTDQPTGADAYDAASGTWEVNGMWRNDAVLQPWTDAPGGTPLGQEIRAHDEVMFHDSVVQVSKFPFPADRDVSVDANPFPNVFTDPTECGVTNLWPFRRLPCGYEYAANASFQASAAYNPPQTFGDPYAGDYWMNQQPDAYTDLLQPPSRAVTPFSYPWNLRGYMLGTVYNSYTSWTNYGDTYDIATNNRGWWNRPMDNPAVWADVFDADPTQPYTWALNLRIDGMERIEDLDLTDQMPYGWRYVPGSAKIISGNWNLGYADATFSEDLGITPADVAIPLVDPAVDATTETSCNVGTYHNGGQTLSWNFEKDGGDDGSAPWDVRYVDSRERYSNSTSLGTYDKGASDKANWIRIHYDAIPDPLVFDCDPDTTSTEKYFMENNVSVQALTDYDPANLITDSFDMIAPVPNPLAFEKTPDDDFVADETNPEYTITFTNGLDVPVEDLTIVDDLTATLGGNPQAPLGADGGYTCGDATAVGGTGFSESVCTGGNTESTHIEWFFDSIAPGETITITIPILVNKDEKNLLIWENNASTFVKEWYDSDFEDDGKITVVNPKAPPTPTKSVTPNPATINDFVEYEVSWTAPEFDVYMDLLYIDTIPDGLTFDSYQGVTCSGGCPGSFTPADVLELAEVVNADGTTTLAWWFGDMPGSATPHTWTMKYRVRVDGTYNDGTTQVLDEDVLTNAVTGYSNEENLFDDPLAIPDPSSYVTYPPSDTTTADLDIEEPELTINKVAVPSATPTDGSSTITYTVTVENTGEIPAYAVEVSDTPNGALENAVMATPTFPGAVTTNGWTTIDPQLQWFITQVNPGDVVTLEYTAEVTDSYLSDGFGTADNEASISSYRARAGLTPEDDDRIYEGDVVETETPLSGPNLVMEKHSGDCTNNFAFAEKGKPHTWCIEVANDGGAPAYGVTVDDTLPYHWTYDGGTTTGTGWTAAEPTTGTLTTNVQTLEWVVGDIAPGDTAQIEFTATPGAESPLNVTNWATAESFGLDGSTLPGTVTGARSSDPSLAALGANALEISKTLDRQEFGILSSGNTASWTITVTNPAPDTANDNLVVTDFLPAPLTFNSWSSTDPRVTLNNVGAAGAGTGGTQEIMWDISDLQAGESIDIQLVTDVPIVVVLGDWYVNDVQVVSDQIVDEVVNQAKVRYLGSDIDIEKTTNDVQADDPNGPGIAPGDPVTWTYTIRNEGQTAFVPATVTDIPAPAGGISCADHNGDTDGDNVIDILLPGDEVICTATGTAVAGPFANNATVSGDPHMPNPETCDCDPDDPDTWPTNPDVFDNLDGSDGEDLENEEDSDPSHYYGANPSIDLEKKTNTFDADDETGPAIKLNGLVTWTYELHNNGNTTLLDVTVTDIPAPSGGIVCDDFRDDTNGDHIIDIMLPGDMVTCTATGSAIDGQFENNATVNGDPVLPDPATCGCDLDDPTSWPDDEGLYEDLLDDEGEPWPNVEHEDPSHYYGMRPSVDIEKRTNGVQADEPVGPAIAPGDPITWTYEVLNDGNTALVGVTVNDIPAPIGGISCADHYSDTDGDNVIDLLLPNETVICTASGIAVDGPFANTSDVAGDPYLPDPETCDCDLSDPSTWPGDPDVYFQPDAEDGEPWPEVTDEDPSHYYGADPSVKLEKSTGIFDADNPTGPAYVPGDTVTWTYDVTNDGNTALAGVTVTDIPAPAGGISCADHYGDTNGDNVIDLMLPDDVVTCTATGIATEGQFENNATVVGTPVLPDPATCDCDLDDPTTWPNDPDEFSLPNDDDGEPWPTVEDKDPSHYYGAVPSVDIEKATNGFDADATPGPGIAPGDLVTWTYVVINTGNTALADVTVTDSQGVTVSCGGGDNVIDFMLPGDEVTCIATGTATAGQYMNLGEVSGTPMLPGEDCDCDHSDPSTWPDDESAFEEPTDENGDPIDDVTDEDPSHYYGSEGELTIEKYTNDVDADDPVGPYISTDGDVTWTFVVMNTTNVAVANATVTDSQGVSVDCGNGSNVIALLLPGESVTCTGTGTAITGQYQNLAELVGDPVLPNPETCGCDPDDPSTWPTDPSDYEPVIDPETGEPYPPMTADDPSHYFGVENKLTVEKSTNGSDADSAGDAKAVTVGDTVTWSYVVTNEGTSAATAITVSDDDPSLTVDCGDGSNVIALLLPGESVTCSASAIATEGPYQNTATIDGTSAMPDPETCGCDPSDPSTWPQNPEDYIAVKTADGSTDISASASDASHYVGETPPPTALPFVPEKVPFLPKTGSSLLDSLLVYAAILLTAGVAIKVVSRRRLRKS